MPVIVNEFEVIAEAPAAQTGSATQPTPSPSPALPPAPEVVEQLMRRALARRLRLLAD